jgi:hypothetical protein
VPRFTTDGFDRPYDVARPDTGRRLSPGYLLTGSAAPPASSPETAGQLTPQDQPGCRALLVEIPTHDLDHATGLGNHGLGGRDDRLKLHGKAGAASASC